GLLSFGHAAFFGGAAYITGFVTKEWGFPPLLGILAGTGFTLILGAIFGFLAIRRQGIYFAMVTLALAQIIYFLALQMPFTGGENGLQGIPRGELLGFIDLNHPLTMYYFVFAIFLIGFGIIHRTIHSPFGEVLQAIRENEPRALSLGYDVERFKLLAFVISATLAGLAGATKAIVFQFAALTNAHWQTSGEVILMTLVGGLGTVFGPVIGAITVGALSHELSAFGSWVQVILGTIFVVCVMVFRRGIVGEVQRLVSRKKD
ncbi:MAG: branched-chain amino acid ABC transporter permease, partial [Marinobacter sp.]|nr:branched-chain amino acid ABC transporter permease [Marinobacter sp.]